MGYVFPHYCILTPEVLDLFPLYTLMKQIFLFLLGSEHICCLPAFWNKMKQGKTITRHSCPIWTVHDLTNLYSIWAYSVIYIYMEARHSKKNNIQLNKSYMNENDVKLNKNYINDRL